MATHRLVVLCFLSLHCQYAHTSTAQPYWLSFKTDRSAYAAYQNGDWAGPTAPYPDLALFLRRDIPTPVSRWISTESEHYLRALASIPPHTLVFPVQTQELGLTRSTRMLMTGLLASALRSAGRVVAPPYVLNKAMGESSRRQSDSYLQSVGHRLQAREMVIVYAGRTTAQDGESPTESNKLRITVLRNTLQQDGNWRSAPELIGEYVTTFDDKTLAHERFRELLPEMLEDLGLGAVTKPQARSARNKLPPLPRNPGEEMTALSDPLERARQLQFLGALAPDRDSRTRESLFERSLLLLETLDSSDPEVRRYRAQAYLQLGFRPKVLHLLDTQTDAYAAALRELANGNLTTALASWQKIPVPFNRLMIGLELRRLQTHYREEDTQLLDSVLVEIGILPASWREIAKIRARSGATWAIPDPNVLTNWLAQHAPISSSGTAYLSSNSKRLMRTQPVTAAEPIKHWRSHMASLPKAWAGRSAVGSVDVATHVELIKSWAVEAVYRELEVEGWTRGQEQSALRRYIDLLPTFDGQPDITYMAALLKQQQASDTDNARSRRLKGEARELAASVYWWEQGQSELSYWSSVIAWNEAPTGGFAHLWRTDYPVLDPFGSNDQDFSYSTRSLRGLAQSYRNTQDTGRKTALAKLLESRFFGHPTRSELLALHAEESGDTVLRQQILTKAIIASPRAFQNYLELARAKLLDGDEAGAVATLKSYPPFQDRKLDELALANFATDAGRLLFHKGRPQLSRHFYQIAAGINNGSEAEQIAKARLGLLDRRWPQVLEHSLRRVRAYDSMQGKRDAIGALILMGRAAEARRLLDLALSEKHDHTIYEAGIALDRLEGIDDQEIEKRAANWHPRDGQMSYAGLTYLTPHFLTDRVISDRFLNEWGRLYQDGTMRYGYRGPMGGLMHGGGLNIKYVKGKKDGFVTWHDANAPEKLMYVFPNEDGLYFRAHRAVQQRDYVTAAREYLEADRMHPMLENRRSTVSFALALAAGGELPQLSARLDSVRNRSEKWLQQVGYPLQLAFLIEAGFRGDRTKASEHYQRALLLAEQKPFQRGAYDFEIVFTLERMAEATNESAFTDWALSMARATTIAKPWVGWAHAYLAVHEALPAQQQLALNRASFLDVNSAFLQKVSPERRKQAKLRTTSNPFSSESADAAPLAAAGSR